METWAAAQPYVNVSLASVSAALGDPGPDEALVIAAILDETLAAWVEDAVDSDHLLPPAKRARDGKLTARNFQLGLRKGTLAHLCAACPPVAAVCDSFLDASTSKVLEGADGGGDPEHSSASTATLSSSGALAAAASPTASAAMSPSSRRRGSASVSPQWSRRREDNPIGERDVLAVVKRVNPALALSNDAQLLCMAVAREMLRHAVATKGGTGGGASAAAGASSAPPVPPSPLAAVAGATVGAASSPRSGASGSNSARSGASSSDGRTVAASAATASTTSGGDSGSPTSVFSSLFPWCPPAVVTRAAQLAHLLIGAHAGTWTPPPATTVRVKVIRPGGWSVSHSTSIAVPFHDPLNAHLDAACRTLHLARKPFVFLHGWALVEPTATPAALHMTDMATIWGVDAKWWDNARRGEARRGALTGTAASASAAAETHVRSIRSKAASKVADDIRLHAVVLHTIAEKRERSLSPGAVASGAAASNGVAGAASPTAGGRSSAAETGDAGSPAAGTPAAATLQAVGRAGMRRARGAAAAAGGGDAASSGGAPGTFITATDAPATSRGTGKSMSPPPSRSQRKAAPGAAAASPTRTTPTKTPAVGTATTAAAASDRQPATSSHRTPATQGRLRGRGDRTPSPAAAEPATPSPADTLPVIRTGGYRRINRSQASRLPMLPSEKLAGLIDTSPATGGAGAGIGADAVPDSGSKMPPRRLLVTPLVGTRNGSGSTSTPGPVAADGAASSAGDASTGAGPQSPSSAAVDFSRLERLADPSTLPDFGKRFQSAPAPTALPRMPEPLPVPAAAAASPAVQGAGSPTQVGRRMGGTRIAATTPTATAVADGRKPLRPPRGGAGAETPAANVAARSPAPGPGRRALTKSSSVTEGSTPAAGATGSPLRQRRFSAGTPVTLGQVRIAAPAAEKLFSKTQATLQPLEAALGSLAVLNQVMLAASSGSVASASPPGSLAGAAGGTPTPAGDSENAPGAAATTPTTAAGVSGVEIDWKQLRVVLRQTQDATAALLSALDAVPDASAGSGVRTGRSPARRR